MYVAEVQYPDLYCFSNETQPLKHSRIHASASGGCASCLNLETYTPVCTFVKLSTVENKLKGKY